MKEYFTDAVVLGARSSGDFDRLADLYTEALGRIEVKVVSGRKINSKLAPHLGIGDLVEARVVRKNSFTATDVLKKKSYIKNSGVRLRLMTLRLFFLLRSLVPTEAPDLNLWHRMIEQLEKGQIDLKLFLRVLGYDSAHAICEGCKNRTIVGFVTENQVFACGKCVRKLPVGSVVLV